MSETTDIIIEPNKLQMNQEYLVSHPVLKLIKDKGIKITLSVTDTAPDDHEKPVMVLIHGNSSSKKAFASQIEHFQDQYRVVAIDLIGHGQSTKLSEIAELTLEEKEAIGSAIYTLPAMIGEVAQVLETKGITNAHILGWSLGGNVAFGLAAEYPELVASIVGIGSPPVKYSAEGLIAGCTEWFVNTLVPQWVNHPAPTSKEEAIMIREHMGFDESDDFFVTDMMTTDPWVRKHLFLKLADYAEDKFDGTSLDACNFVRKTEIPVCLIIGDQDAGINHKFVQSFENELNNEHSVVKIVPEARHAIFKTHPEEYYKVISEFIEASIAPADTIDYSYK